MAAKTANAQDEIRVATFAAPLSRDGPGLLLRDVAKGDDPQIAAVGAIIDTVAPDILLLTDFDHDAELVALRAFNARLARPFDHVFALPGNAGLATGVDMDGNGRLGEPRDAQGYGRFLGDGGLALLSRFPVIEDEVRDFTDLIWSDLPGAAMPVTRAGGPFPSSGAQAMARLSSTGHWVVPLRIAGDRTLTLLAYSATPPVFDGPEDRNGLRNRDELRFWLRLLAGDLGPVPDDPVVLLGNTNLDPADGDGFRQAMAELLAHPQLQDPRPRSAGGAANPSPGHSGDPALDTADWTEDGPGNLRVSYVLPDRDLTVADTGVFWPAPDDPKAALLGLDGLAAGPHRLVWVDIVR
ncbi:MAG: endonuclease/exonuclease/phosphatase family protein [Alphaproteobacteria bacterium]|jgi:hypothetical protein|nr:endonuclease/exonuclease/phosphatase family protein [Alphaproteobacteria bacterium]